MQIVQSPVIVKLVDNARLGTWSSIASLASPLIFISFIFFLGKCDDRDQIQFQTSNLYRRAVLTLPPRVSSGIKGFIFISLSFFLGKCDRVQLQLQTSNLYRRAVLMLPPKVSSGIKSLIFLSFNFFFREFKFNFKL